MSRSPKKIPKNAKKVFEGEIFDVWQWEQEMFDGTTETFEELARPDTMQVIAVTTDKKILVIKEQQPNRKPALIIPGGRHDKKETPLAAAKRELLEETGYSAPRWKLWFVEKPVSKLHWDIYTYIAKGAKRVSAPKLDAGEKISVYKFSFDQFIRLGENTFFHDPGLRLHLMRALYNKKEYLKLKNFLFN